MEALKTFLERVADFENRAPWAESTLSRKLFDDGKTLGRIRRGGNVTVRTMERARARLDHLESTLPKSEAA